jgi:uncharacterized protein
LKIKSLIWFDDIVDKLASKHQVNQDEVREVLLDRPHFRFVEKGHRSEENVYAALGQTESGRYLILFFVRERDGRAIILSARDMTPGERKKYEEK